MESNERVVEKEGAPRKDDLILITGAGGSNFNFPFLSVYTVKETGNALILSSETEAGSAEEQPAEG